MKNIFMIKTPLQLLNAVEAKHSFNLQREDCVLIVMGDRKSQPQILKLVGAVDEWNKVIALNDVNMFSGGAFKKSKFEIFRKLCDLDILKRSVFYVHRLNKLSKFFGSVDYIFIGYTRYIYMTHFVNVTPHKELVLLDDGNGAFELAYQRKNSVSPVSDFGIRKKIKLLGKRIFQNIQDKENEDACFFTAYDISAGENDRIVKNEFSYLRSNVKNLPITDDVYFIGSPLSEVGIISLDEYLMSIKRIKQYFYLKQLVYIAHRRDSPDKLKAIESRLKIKVVLFDYPIEYQLAYLGPRPSVLASFFSAALDSCRLVFGDELSIISFRLNLEKSTSRKRIELIYDNFEASTSDKFFVESNY